MNIGHFLTLLGACLFSAGAPGKDAGPFHFDKPPFVSPAIISDLSTWISDTGDQVISIDLDGSNSSNRYSGDLSIDKARKSDGHSAARSPFVKIDNKDGCGDQGGTSTFGYELIGRIKDVFVLHTVSGGCGTAAFSNLLLVKVEPDAGLSYRDGTLRPTTRHVIRKLTEIPIGDRYDGQVIVEGNKILIRKDRDQRDPVITADTVIELN